MFVLAQNLIKINRYPSDLRFTNECNLDFPLSFMVVFNTIYTA